MKIHKFSSKFQFLAILPESVRSGCRRIFATSSATISDTFSTIVILDLGNIEKNTNRPVCNTMAKLRVNINEVSEDISCNIIWNACDGVWSHLEAVTEAVSGYYE